MVPHVVYSHLLDAEALLLALQTWAAFYQGRWRLPQAALLGGTRWQEVYGTKMRLAQAWHGRFKQDLLYGHRGGVRSTALQPSCQLLATGGPPTVLFLFLQMSDTTGESHVDTC